MQIQAYVLYVITRDELRRVDVARKAGYIGKNPCAKLTEKLDSTNNITIHTAVKLLQGVDAKLCIYDPKLDTYIEVSPGETSTSIRAKEFAKKNKQRDSQRRALRKKQKRDYRRKLVSATKRTAKRVREQVWEEYYTKAQETAWQEVRAKKAEYQRNWRANKKRREQELLAQEQNTNQQETQTQETNGDGNNEA